MLFNISTGKGIALAVLIVLVLWGVLDIFVRRIGEGYRQEAYGVAMREDLRQLAAFQQRYFERNHRYTASPDRGFRPSAGVTVTIGVADTAGFNATARHSESARICGIFVGTAPPPVAGATEGEPMCQVAR